MQSKKVAIKSEISSLKLVRLGRDIFCYDYEASGELRDVLISDLWRTSSELYM